jgi:hypothetical protein
VAAATADAVSTADALSPLDKAGSFIFLRLSVFFSVLNNLPNGLKIA